MNREEVELLVNAHIEPYCARLKLEAWTVVVNVLEDEAEFDRRAMQTGAAACILPQAEYRAAEMHMCAPRVWHAEGARRLLRHELLHLVLADLNPYRDLSDALVAASAKRGDAHGRLGLEHMWQQSIERAVWQLEMLLDASGWVWEVPPPLVAQADR